MWEEEENILIIRTVLFFSYIFKDKIIEGSKRMFLELGEWSYGMLFLEKANGKMTNTDLQWPL